MPPPKDPIGAVVRNLLLLKRLENGVAAEVDALVRSLFDDIAAQIQRLDPTAPPQQAYRRRRIEKLIGAVDELSGDTYDEILKRVRQRAAEIGAQQAGYAEDLLDQSIGNAVGVDIKSGRVGINLLKSIIDTNPIQGELLKDWFDGQADNVKVRVRRQIQLGMAQGETVDEIVRRVRGRSAGRGRFAGGVMQTTTRQAETIVRTSVQQIANTAHFRTFEANQDITQSFRITSALDSRTCPICRPLDGREFRYDDEQARRPIFHPACRCVAVPVISWEALGLEPPPEGMRASADGPVPASTTYDDWLRNQSPAEQDRILGPERAQLFRDGKVTLREMVRDDGSIVRVEELQGPNIEEFREVFVRAFSNPTAAEGYYNELRQRFAGNPEVEAFVAAMEEWQSTPGLRRLRPRLRAAAQGEATDDLEAVTFLRWVNDAGPDAPELWRGISRVESPRTLARGEYKKGAVLDWEPQSFTTDPDIATRFTYEEAWDRPTKVVFRLRPGARALRVENVAIWAEREWINAPGKFRVLRSRVVDNKRLEVEIEQVEES